MRNHRLQNLVSGPWRDALVIGCLVVGLEAETFAFGPQGGWLVLHAFVAAVMGAAAFWRHRAPLACVLVVVACAIVVISDWSSAIGVVAPTYLLIVVPYWVAREATLARALVGLTALLAFGFAANATSNSAAGWYLGAPVLTGASWGVGRWLRARTLLNEELTHNAERIDAERASRISLAVADERTRIARELHTVVAANLSAMVIQTEAAELLLDDDPRAADGAMAAVEQTGRDALSDMRRLLGVLRHSGDLPTLMPQPGVGELYVLVDAARAAGRTVELSVEGEPGPLPASVDLEIYRVVEEAITAGESGNASIRLWFGQEKIDLEVSVPGGDRRPTWPTLAMRERAALCNGSIHSEVTGDQERLFTSFPRTLEEVFV